MVLWIGGSGVEWGDEDEKNEERSGWEWKIKTDT